MKTTLKTLESPDKRYQLKLEKRFSFLDLIENVSHDKYYLIIKDKSSLIERIFPRRRKLGESHYDPIITPSGNPLGGNIVKKININPRKDYVNVTILRRISNNFIVADDKETIRFDYSGKRMD